jgi:hypothetical protein
MTPDGVQGVYARVLPGEVRSSDEPALNTRFQGACSACVRHSRTLECQRLPQTEQAKPPSQSIGLGFFIARTLNEQMGGRLYVEARPADAS